MSTESPIDLRSFSRMRSSAAAAPATIVSASAAPYGYMVSLSSSSAPLIHFHRATEPFARIFVLTAPFSARALGRFAHGALRTTLQRVLRGSRADRLLHRLHVRPRPVALVAEVPSWIAWLLGSLIATSVYLLTASLQLAFVTAHAARTHPNP